jgi:hypothetical protein
MNASEYKEMAEKIQAEIESLEIQQEDIERRLARLRQALLGLAPLGQELPSDALGSQLTAIYAGLEAMSITDATRQIFQAASAPLTPIEIKQQLINMGKDLSDQKNVMASIHSLLKRLVKSDEIETKDNGLTYQWKGIRRYPRTEANLKAEAIRQNKVAAGRTKPSGRY